MLTLDLLRHGALEGGVKYRGAVDEPLTPEGRAAMDQIWQTLRRDVDLIISSPLRRCAEPARAWATGSGIECRIDTRLAEMAYGAWEGHSAAEIRRRWPGMLEQWRADPTGMRPPGGESPEELRARLRDWWRETRTQLDGAHLLIVAHSGSLRMLIALLLEQPVAYTRSLDMPYACHYRIIYHNGMQPLICRDSHDDL